jgi:membrane protein DedA with SNARE-associated domain
LTLVGSAIWCFAFAAAGWALGGSWKSFHNGFGYVDIVFVAVLIAAIGLFSLRRVRSRARRGQAPSRAGSDRAGSGPSMRD